MFKVKKQQNACCEENFEEIGQKILLQHCTSKKKVKSPDYDKFASLFRFCFFSPVGGVLKKKMATGPGPTISTARSYLCFLFSFFLLRLVNE